MFPVALFIITQNWKEQVIKGTWKQIVVHLFSKILISNNLEKSIDLYNMNKIGKYYVK